MRMPSRLSIGALVPCAMIASASAIFAQELHPFPVGWSQVFSPPSGSPFASREIGSGDRVVAGPDGHTYAAGVRLRFWGGNVTFGSNFPDKARADAIARRMASLGVNLLRFHHTDSRFSPEGIWAGSGPDRELDPERLDRLDYFISRLSKAGIYVDINLLVGRPFMSGPGLDPAIEDIKDWKDRAVPGFFDRQCLELQKDYARKLLSRRNPYTGLSYAEDPAVAFVEVNNENGLVQAYLQGIVDELPERYRGELGTLWNDFLARAYPSDEALAAAWGARREALGPSLLKDGEFAKAGPPWILERHDGAQASIERIAGGGRGIAIKTTKAGSESWHVQLAQGGFGLEAGRTYTLRFSARGSGYSRASAEISMAREPWSGLGVSVPIAPSAEWKEYSVSFALPSSEEAARVLFTGLGRESCRLELRDASLSPGGTLGLDAGESLAARSIRPFFLRGYREAIGRTDRARLDWFAFLRETEGAYWREMRELLKGELGVKALVVGTITGTSLPSLQAAFDAVDSHAYWRHPAFPGRPWDQKDWYVGNDPMVLHPAESTVAAIGLEAVEGKPRLVTEYNEPAPSLYEAEAFPFLAAYAGLQDADAVLSFDFGSIDGSADGRIEGFFATGTNPVKTLSQVAAALSFRRGDVASARSTRRIALSDRAELESLLGAGAWRIVGPRALGVEPWAALERRVVIEAGAAPGEAAAPSGAAAPSVPPAVIASDTGELRWDSAAGVVVLDAPRQKWAWGFLGGGPVELGGARVAAGTGAGAGAGQAAAKGFRSLTLASLDGESVERSRALLLTVLGSQRNADDRWFEYPDKKTGYPPALGARVTHREYWGKGPSLVEVFALELVLPGSGWRMRALDAEGRALREYEGTPAAGGATAFSVSAKDAVPWYELTR
jgi:hypothetical protein